MWSNKLKHPPRFHFCYNPMNHSSLFLVLRSHSTMKQYLKEAPCIPQYQRNLLQWTQLSQTSLSHCSLWTSNSLHKQMVGRSSNSLLQPLHWVKLLPCHLQNTKRKRGRAGLHAVVLTQLGAQMILNLHCSKLASNPQCSPPVFLHMGLCPSTSLPWISLEAHQSHPDIQLWCSSCQCACLALLLLLCSLVVNSCWFSNNHCSCWIRIRIVSSQNHFLDTSVQPQWFFLRAETSWYSIPGTPHCQSKWISDRKMKWSLTNMNDHNC